MLLSPITFDGDICWLSSTTWKWMFPSDGGISGILSLTWRCVSSYLRLISKQTFVVLEGWMLSFVSLFSWRWSSGKGNSWWTKTFMGGGCIRGETFWLGKYFGKETTIRNVLCMISVEVWYLQLCGNSCAIWIPFFLLWYTNLLCSFFAYLFHWYHKRQSSLVLSCDAGESWRFLWEILVHLVDMSTKT